MTDLDEAVRRLEARCVEINARVRGLNMEREKAEADLRKLKAARKLVVGS